MSPVLHKLARSEKGFTLAEVIIAMVVFVASIVGISMMLMSGSGAVTRGAMENAATQLAQKKIEDIKTLPFYTPYTGPNQDVDDFYFNTAYTNQDPQQLTAVQTSNPTAYEKYGYISGYGKYKRTTAIQYQTVTPSALTPTTMNTNWVPKAATGNTVVPPLFDKPADNVGTSGNPVRMLLAVVTVYYHDPNSGLEVSYKAQSVVSDLMTTGGTNNPILQVKSINPTSGDLNNTNFTMDVTVVSQGLTSSDTVSVYLWYEGQTDNPATSVTVISSTDIRCVFNLADHTAADNSSVTVRPGVYSIAVYWQNKGWKDTSFRNCFTVTTPPPGFSSISNHTWGYNGQTARPVVITGSAFQYVQTVTLTNGANIITGIITNNPSTTEIDCSFNLSTITGTNQRCDITITTRGGTIVSNTDAERLLVNPTPVVTNIVQTNGTVFSWGHSGMASRQVQFTGSYLYGFNPTYDTSTRTLNYNSYGTSAGAFISGGYGNTCDAGVSGYDTNSVTFTYDLTSPGSGATWTTANTKWNPTLTNAGGTASITADTQRFLMNPTPVVTSISATSSPSYYSWAHSGQWARNICITGNYLYGFNGNGSITGYQASPTGFEAYIAYSSTYHTTGTVTCVSGPTGNEASPLSQSATFTISPNSAGVGYNQTNQYWDTYLRNYGGLVHESGTGTAGGQVLFNPTPQITAITSTSVGSYYNWGHLGLSSRAVQIQGNYLYDLSDSGGALAEMTYGANRTYATANAGSTATGTTLNTEIGTEPVTVTFNPSSGNTSSLLWTSPNSYWNVYVKNFGGTSDSNPSNASTSAISVFMNPTPTVTGITGTQTPTSGDSNSTVWTYRAQTSTLTTSITGTNLYALTASSAALKIAYGVGATSTSYCNGTYTDPDPGCTFALNTSQTVTTTFTPSTGNLTNTTNSLYYEIYLKNYGGTVDTDSGGANTNLSVWMNPPPKIISWSNGSLITATTGLAAASGGGTKIISGLYPYTGITLTGNYIQGNTAPQEYIVESNTAPAVGTSTTPTTGNASAQLSGSSSSETWANPSADGTSISGLNILMYVNPSANYFYTWGTTAPTTTHVFDTILNSNGTNNYGYYVYIVNPDGQHYMTNLSTKITHASYTFTFGSYQNTVSNTLFGKPTNTSLPCYQDGYVTNSATSNSGTNAIFKDWMEGSTSLGGVATNQTFSATGNRTITCRFKQWLWKAGTDVVPWRASGSPAYSHGTNDYYKNCYPNSSRTAHSGTGWIELWAESSGSGEVSTTTTNSIDLTGCTSAHVSWENTDGGSNGQAWLIVKDTPTNTDYNTGRTAGVTPLSHIARNWTNTNESVSFSGLTTGKYIVLDGRFNSNDWERLWVNEVWLE